MVATDQNTAYPPIVDSSIPAFIKEQLKNFSINFRVPLVVNYKDVQCIAVRIVQQENNLSIYNEYDGILYLQKPKNYDSNGNYTISYNDLIDFIPKLNWKEDYYYKIQIAFGYQNFTLDNFNTIESFFNWKSTLKLSEWSNVIITKLISKPIVRILNNLDSENYTSENLLQSSDNAELGIYPIFEASYKNSVEEPLYQYKFDLYDNKNDLVESSDWITFDNTLQDTKSVINVFSHKFNNALKENIYYQLYLSILTKNNYKETLPNPYCFHIVETYLTEDLKNKGFHLLVKDNSNNDFPRTDENGSLEIYLRTENNINGKYYLIRTSEQSNYQRWEDLAKFNFYGTNDYCLDWNGSFEKQRENFIITKNDLNYIYYPAYEAIKDNNNKYKIKLTMKNFDNFSDSYYNININESGKEYSYFSIELYYDKIQADYNKENQDEFEFILEYDKPILFPENKLNQLLLYEDFTIESGIKYKYALQRENFSGTRRTQLLYDNNDKNKVNISNFQHTYLYCNGIQLRLNYDAKIQSFKRTRLAQKQDGLNSKYPIIVRNGLANYAEFQLAGKITLHSDEYDTFFYRNHSLDNRSGYYFENELIIPKEKYYWDPKNYSIYKDDLSFTTFDYNPSDNNIFMERMYRNQVEKFLNNNNYKLFKSPTEGNYIVTLFNISLSPNQQLGRMIADFSSTVYEVADNTLNNLKTYLINPLEVKTNRMRMAENGTNTNVKYSFGQVRNAFDGELRKAIKINSELYNELLEKGFKPFKYFYKDGINYISNEDIPANLINYLYQDKKKQLEFINNTFFDSKEDDIFNWIKNQEENYIDESFEQKYEIKNIDSLTFEIYPKYNIEQEIFRLKAQLNSNLNQYNRLDKLRIYLQIAKYNLILKQYSQNQNYPITLVLNGKEVQFMPGRTYHLEDINIDSLYLKYTRPILVNYTVKKEIVDAPLHWDIEEKKYNSIRKISNVGQLFGIFTENSDIIKNHDKINEYLQYGYNIYDNLDITKNIRKNIKERIYLNYGTDLISPIQQLQDEIDELLIDEILISIPYEEQVSKFIKLINQYKQLARYEREFSDYFYDVWMNPQGHIIIYELSDFDYITTEVDKNTQLRLKDEGKDGRSIFVGPTNTYKLNLENKDPTKIQLSFSEPTFGLINYRANVIINIREKIQS